MKTQRSNIVMWAMIGLLGIAPCKALSIEKPARLVVGFGMSYIEPPISEEADLPDPFGTGGYLEVEYGLRVTHWFEPRAYAGVIFTSTDEESTDGISSFCDISSKTGFVGGKLHVLMPIPYIGPFFEVGIGGSVGTISSQVGGLSDHRQSGLMYHVPFAVGLGFGKEHRYELTLTYLYYPSYRHIDGATAIGIDLPIH